jgi:hypothetical protein
VQQSAGGRLGNHGSSVREREKVKNECERILQGGPVRTRSIVLGDHLASPAVAPLGFDEDGLVSLRHLRTRWSEGLA